MEAGPSKTSDALIPRPGPEPKLTEGPKIGQRSLYQQQVLDEDTYTKALSHIISRDFFPNLPHLHATNDYLTALANNDPELLSSSIRRLARIAQEKDDRQADGRGGTTGKGKGKGREAEEDDEEEREEAMRRKRELEMLGTPYISMPGGGTWGRGGLGARTPIGARGWETPSVRGSESTRRRPSEAEDVLDFLDGDSVNGKSWKRRAAPKSSRPFKRVRDDLSLDAFQRNYTSEDNASFAQILENENERRKEERWGWAWEVERRAEKRRIEGETKRKMILDAATGGNWRVDGNGKRLVGGLDEGGADKPEGEAWEARRMIKGADVGEVMSGTNLITAGSVGQEEGKGESTALVAHSSTLGSTLGSSNSLALTKPLDPASSASALPPARVEEQVLPSDHPLSRALISAGLPPTALVSTEDGAIVPHAEAAAGGGGELGRGRGDDEKERRRKIEKAIMQDDEQRARDHLTYAGTGADQWPYKMMNNLMFPPDAYTKPYPPPRSAANTVATMEKIRQAPPQISHANTRLSEEQEDMGSGSRAGSRRGSSPARSWVDAAVKGTPYRPGSASDESMPTIDSYPLVATDPSPAPEDLPPLMTWGTLLATPRVLDNSNDDLDLDGPSFHMPETKRRDEIGRRLGNKASRSISDRAKSFTPRPAPSTPSLSEALRAAAEKTKRADGSVRGTMAPPSVRGLGGGGGGSTPRRQEALTPAARSLLDRSLGRTPKIGNSGVNGSESGGLGAALGASARARGAAMEKGAGWVKSTIGTVGSRGTGGNGSGGGSGGGNGERGRQGISSRSWTPSPAHR